MRDVLARAADERKFEVVNHPGHVHRDEREQAALDEVADEEAESVLDDVRAGHPDDGMAGGAGG